MIKNKIKKRKTMRKRILTLFLAMVLLVTNCITLLAAYPTYGDDLDMSGVNEWQVPLSSEYSGNGPEHKTTVSADGMVRVQKNVVPTNTENQFLVYLAIDVMSKKVATYQSITSMLEVNSQSLYVNGAGNGFPDNTGVDVRPGNGSLSNSTQGAPKPLETPVATSPYFTIQIKYNGLVIAEPKLQLVVPNSVFYLKVGTQYIALDNIRVQGGVITVGGQTPTVLSDGSYLVPVNLTDNAYNALFNTIVNEETQEETVIVFDNEGSASIVDPMGSYIVFDGFVNGDIYGTAPAAATEAGTSVTWNISPKATDSVNKTDPVVTVTQETITRPDGSTVTTRVTTTTQWYLNVAEIIYKVYLDVEKAGFTSGTLYDVNGTTVLNYNCGADTCSVIFPVPQVLGTLYDFSFSKVDAQTGNSIPGAEFTLKDANDKEWLASEGGLTGNWKFKDLPWGTYTLTEVNAPDGYLLGDITTWTLNIGYTEDIKDEELTDHIHYDDANDIYIGNNDVGAATWTIKNSAILKVTYIVNSDVNYGKPISSVTPIDGTNYKSGDLVTVFAALTTTQTYAVVGGVNIPGTWEFSGWNKTDFIITANTDIKGSWKFTPTTYALNYVVAEDAVYGTPTDAVNPANKTGIAYNTDETLGVVPTTSWTTSDGTADGIPGTWKFTGWSSDTNYAGDPLTTVNIKSDVTVYGKWEFTADLVDVKVTKVWNDNNSGIDLNMLKFNYIVMVLLMEKLLS